MTEITYLDVVIVHLYHIRALGVSTEVCNMLLDEIYELGVITYG